MNEHVKKLAEDAGFVLWKNEDWNPGDVIDWASRYDNEFVDYTHALVEDVFLKIRDISTQNSAVTHEELKNTVLEFYKDKSNA